MLPKLQPAAPAALDSRFLNHLSFGIGLPTELILVTTLSISANPLFSLFFNVTAAQLSGFYHGKTWNNT
ncbi:hypothetical protein [Gilvimarinus sp. DA14]|uniref:hypothetical protein n=1 Tax=Gilvimarinus sp. DA14 TaxID=2956798 RepID=UPI0020B71708|nr:hypothetical protein [Gilvimarinus sp. DA14]UTF61018.1 hypothetical protein NHM04_04260 [Gilvimarinus sp. DA14]